jgi:poly-gamma-glutamate synthesis protein (capsule biosynthesis protein)
VSARGAPIAERGKRFFFRAPPVAAERLAEMGVACATLANNHVLDFGREALDDTLRQLAMAGIATAGAGTDRERARASVTLSAGGHRVRVLAAADHPASYAAGGADSGIAFADLERHGVPDWLRDAARPGDGELVLVSVHWGPNMVDGPVPHVRSAAEALEASGATLVAGHSAHVPHPVRGRVLFDLGDFVDDYRVDPVLRNDLSLLWLVTLDEGGPRRVEGIPAFLEYAYTRPADRAEAAQLARLLADRCVPLGSQVDVAGDRLVFGS